jgi:hypothetical protein
MDLAGPTRGKKMANNTDNNTAGNDTAGDTNMTSDILDVVKESGLLEEPMVLALLACVAALVAFVCYTNPTLKAAVLPILNKYLKRYNAQIEALLESNLTKAQQVAYEKLDATLQAQIKDELLRNVILTAWDEKDDELKSLVKSKVKAALNNNR